jgi:hypothetical protein
MGFKNLKIELHPTGNYNQMANQNFYTNWNLKKSIVLERKCRIFWN